MRTLFLNLISFLLIHLSFCNMSNAEENHDTSTTLKELNQYWKEVSRCVKTGDFQGYSDTCHPTGILVSGTKQTTYPLEQALQGWKQGFDDTQAGKMTASVQFRFSKRLHDATTAHETGIFRYASSLNGKTSVQFIHFEGLLRKTPSGWKILMEYQKSIATETEWKKLPPATESMESKPDHTASGTSTP